MSNPSFIASIQKNSLARTNRFRVEIPLPIEIQNKFFAKENKSKFAKGASILRDFIRPRGDIVRGLDIMCESCSIPGRAFITAERKDITSIKKIPYGVQYDDMDFTFYVSKDMLEKDLIDAWMDVIFDRAQHNFEYQDEYAQDIVIHQLDQNEEIQHSVTLKSAYPMTLNAMEVSNAGVDEFHRISVSFAYHQWYTGDDIEGEEGGVDSFLKDPVGFVKENKSKIGHKLYDIATGNDPGFAGEALAVYEKLSSITEEYTGISVNELDNMLDIVKGDLASNSNVGSGDKNSLNSFVDSIKNSIK